MEFQSLFLRSTLPVLLGFLVWLSHPVAGAQETATTIERKALDRIKEARGHARQERYSRALSDLRVAVALAEQSDRTKLILALALHNMAEVYRLDGKSGEALKAYYQALRIYSELDHKPAIAVTEAQIDALRAGSNIEMPAGTASGSSAPAGEPPHRLDRIDRAVERIRSRLGSNEQPAPAGANHPSGETPGVIEISKSSPRARPEGVPASYQESVVQRVRGEWKYPESARSKHQEGTVEIEFAILSTGELESIRILQSSGFLTLDLESVRSVRQSAPFAALPGDRQQTSLRLMFSYELPESGEARVKARVPKSPSSSY